MRGVLALWSLILLSLLPLSAHALDVTGMRFGVHADKTRLVIETSESVPFKAFLLRQPDRLAIDLPAFIWQAGQVAPPGRSQLTQIRYAANRPGVSRIVVDLAAPHRIQSAFTLPAQDGRPPRLVIDLVSGAGQSDDSHGTLETAAASFGAAAPPLRSAVPPPVKPKPREKPLIVIDPGHGGRDPGAVSPINLKEKDIVLRLSKELRDYLLSTGQYRVKLTRDDDRFIRLRDRVNKARNWGADMFISVHADSINRSNVRGASVYTLSNKASDAQTAQLAARENRADLIAGVDLTHEEEDIADILIDLATRDTMNQSRFFANTLVDTLRNEGIRLLTNPHRYAGFAVLKAPDIPSVLIEAGFLSNRKDAQALTREAYRKQIVTAIGRGVSAYFARLNDS